MAYDGIRYNCARFKASHNSYDRDETIAQQLQWDGVHRAQSGCRGLEFDIWRHSDNSGGRSRSYFNVAHTGVGNATGGRELADYLQMLRVWHAGQTNHDPIIVHIDIKSSEGSKTVFPAEIDAYLRTWFDEGLILKPASLMDRPGESLLAACARKGWPTVGNLRGKFLFCLSGNEDWKRFYADTTGPGSLCFADFAVDDDKTIGQLSASLPSNRVVINVNVFSAHFDKWKTLVPALTARGYFVRAYVLDSDGLWSKGIQGRINALSTNKIRGHDWAHVGNEPFVAI